MASATEKLLRACNSFPASFCEGITSLYRLAVTITSPSDRVCLESVDEVSSAHTRTGRAASTPIAHTNDTQRQSLSIGLFFNSLGAGSFDTSRCKQTDACRPPFRRFTSSTPRKLMTKSMAGLLTYSGNRGLPNRHNQWLSSILGTSTGAYSSGTVRDFHPIPFSFYAPDGVSKPMRDKGNTNY